MFVVRLLIRHVNQSAFIALQSKILASVMLNTKGKEEIEAVTLEAYLGVRNTKNERECLLNIPKRQKVAA